MRWKHGTDPIVVKFLLVRGAYEPELQLCKERALRRAMQETVAEVPAGATQSVRGHVFLSCIILATGEEVAEPADF